LKPKDSRVGIRSKLFACLALFVALTLALLWLLQAVFLDDFYKMIKTNMIKKNASLIARNLDNSPEDLQALVTRLSQNGELCIIVYDLNDNGAYLADSDVLIGCLVHKIIPYDRYRLCMEAVTPVASGWNCLKLTDFAITNITMIIFTEVFRKTIRAYLTA
jgi:hypothetical protein